jgi:hypothetical protein
MSSNLSSCLAGLREVFTQNADKYAAHRAAAPILQDIAASPAIFTEILERHFARADALTQKHYPVVSVEIDTNPHFGLVANCWIPLPDRDTDMSTKAIHHHGDMLLTTVTAFGPGYEHWTFTPAERLEPEGEMYAMRLIERAPHPTSHAAFVDADTGHVPFYVPSLTITLALWSSRKPTSWKDVVKRVPALHKQAATLRRVASSVGLSRALDLKVVRYFDFFPTPQGFRGMRERQEFPRGPVSDYLQSLFHIVQATGNEALAETVRRRLSATPDAPSVAATLLDDLEHGRSIEGRLSDGHYGVPFANFRADAIETALRVATSAAGSRA